MGVEHGKTNENKWSLANLNPLSWLFPSKSDDLIKSPKREHLPISRRAGLSNSKNKETYNDLRVNRNTKDRRKRRRKQPSLLLQGPRRHNKSNNRLRERRRRKRRKQQASNRRLRQNKAPYYENKNGLSNHDEVEHDFEDTELTFSEARETNQRRDNEEYDLVMSDYDLRWPSR